MIEKPDLSMIGLTDGESKVYMALIELGSSTVGPIVKKSGVAYSNVYSILNRLVQKGIASYILKSKTKYFQVVSPSSLLEYLEKKEEELKKQKDSLKTIIPRLEHLQMLKPQQDAEIFLGKKGLKSAYVKLFLNSKATDENLFFYIHEKEYAKESDMFFFGSKEVFSKVPSKGIANKFAMQSEFIKQTNIGEFRYVEFPVPGNIEICGNKILLISWKKPIIAVLIQSESIAENFSNYFYEVWNLAKKPANAR